MASAPSHLGSATLARPRRRAWLAIRRLRIAAPERGWLILGTVGFIAMSAWWLTRNQRIPDWDDGAHLLDALTAETQMTSGHFGALFRDFNLYPPGRSGSCLAPPTRSR